MSLLELSLTFFNIGLFTIGGGSVAITLMQQMIVDRALISRDLFFNMIAISEATPGPIGINMATYVGFTLHGPLGAVIVTLSEAAPSVLCIILIAKFLSKFGENPLVTTIFTYLRPVSTALIMSAAANLCRAAIFNNGGDFSKIKTIGDFFGCLRFQSLGFFLVLTALQLRFKIHPLLIIASGAIFGVIFL